MYDIIFKVEKSLKLSGKKPLQFIEVYQTAKGSSAENGLITPILQLQDLCAKISR